MCCLARFDAVETPCTCAENMLKFSYPCFQYFLNHLRNFTKLQLERLNLQKHNRLLLVLVHSCVGLALKQFIVKNNSLFKDLVGVPIEDYNTDPHPVNQIHRTYSCSYFFYPLVYFAYSDKGE